jgi:hypothetical protein
LLGDAGDYFEDLPDIHRFAVKCFDIAAGRADHRGQLGHRLDIAFNHLLTVFGQLPRIAGLVGGLSGVTRDFLGGFGGAIFCAAFSTSAMRPVSQV